jgi:hypothetical protein
MGFPLIHSVLNKANYYTNLPIIFHHPTNFQSVHPPPTITDTLPYFVWKAFFPHPPPSNRQTSHPNCELPGRGRRNRGDGGSSQFVNPSEDLRTARAAYPQAYAVPFGSVYASTPYVESQSRHSCRVTADCPSRSLIPGDLSLTLSVDHPIKATTTPQRMHAKSGFLVCLSVVLLKYRVPSESGKIQNTHSHSFDWAQCALDFFFHVK